MPPRGSAGRRRRHAYRSTPSPLLSPLRGPSNRAWSRRSGECGGDSAPLHPPTLTGKAATSPPPPRLRGVDAQRVELGRCVRCLPPLAPPPCRDASVGTLALKSLVLDFYRTGCDVIRGHCICVRVPIWLLSLLGFGSVRAFSSMFESRLALGFLVCCGIRVFGLLLT
ncbi:hypothetical protein PVAP13_1KG111346 [Panicum virgatum]|uniref:Uncharacterized protein n=1 Tax=Panicum virgatum TaxID=38727 RepID=A0A8T0XS12_PANVG|nr:hypothetical protein PVAP13_1KG111346 [Panicum virgatum]